MKKTNIKDNKILPFIIAGILSAVTISLCLLFAKKVPVEKMMDNIKTHNIFMSVFGFIFIFAVMALCIVLRYKKQSAILKGIVIYQLIGVIAFVIHFILLLAGEESFLSVASSYVYYWWTYIFHDSALLFVELVHFPVRYVIALFLGMITYTSVKSLQGIKVDNNFESKIKDKHDAEELSNERAKQNIPQSAKDIRSE